MLCVRESVKTTNSFVGPVNSSEFKPIRKKASTQGGSGLIQTADAKGRRPGTVSVFRPRHRDPVVGLSASFLQRGGPFADTVETSLVEIGWLRRVVRRQGGLV